MSRDMTAAMDAEILKKEVQPIILVEMSFDSGTLRLWSGIGNTTWNGETWYGTGDLGKVSAIRETEAIQAEGITLELSGIPTENISLALSENYQGRPALVWLGFLNSSLSVIADPKRIFSGRMDIMEIDEDAETSVIAVTVESRMIDLLKPREWRYTHEDQQIEYPGDLGLEFVASIQNKEVNWVPS